MPDPHIERFITECESATAKITRSGLDELLRDEARFTGHADALIEVTDEAQAAEVMRTAQDLNVPITIAAAQTSLTGAAVPDEGVILRLKGFDTMNPDDPTDVGPGIVLGEYRKKVASHGLFYPPDPTSEHSCTLGGSVACNASGALSYAYGPTAEYVQSLRVLLPTGDILDIERGDVTSRDSVFYVPGRLLWPKRCSELTIPAPQSQATDWHECKNVAGLFAGDPMDLVDLFIGSEGILGLILRIGTILLPRRRPYFGLMLYLPTRAVTLETVRLLDLCTRRFKDGEAGLDLALHEVLTRLAAGGTRCSPDDLSLISPSCMEWIGAALGEFLSPARRERITDCFGCLYVEQEYPEGEDPIVVAEQWAGLATMLEASHSAEGRPIATELALTENQIRAVRQDRLSVPEKLNELVQPGMRKIATDFAVPREHLPELLTVHETVFSDTVPYIFGHIGNAHLHVNVLPKTREEALVRQNQMIEIARHVCAMGGTVTAEHGIGKLKRELLRIMLGDRGIEEIRHIKRALDPHEILNRGNMAPYRG